eukprot:m.146176 g.146176  ORF g.146176 m.146176 type:complete len:1287 (+) comp14149_c0_seq1:23-3883(+)
MLLNRTNLMLVVGIVTLCVSFDPSDASLIATNPFVQRNIVSNNFTSVALVPPISPSFGDVSSPTWATSMPSGWGLSTAPIANGNTEFEGFRVVSCDFWSGTNAARSALASTVCTDAGSKVVVADPALYNSTAANSSDIFASSITTPITSLDSVPLTIPSMLATSLEVVWGSSDGDSADDAVPCVGAPAQVTISVTYTTREKSDTNQTRTLAVMSGAAASINSHDIIADVITFPLLLPSDTTSFAIRIAFSSCATSSWFVAVKNVNVFQDSSNIQLHSHYHSQFNSLPLTSPPTLTTSISEAWTSAVPLNWAIDSSGTAQGGVEEFRGWRFMKKAFWAEAQGDVSRDEDVLAVADQALWAPDTSFSSTLKTEAVSLSGVLHPDLTIAIEYEWLASTAQQVSVLVKYNTKSVQSLAVLRQGVDREGRETLFLKTSIPFGASSISVWVRVSDSTNGFFALRHIELQAFKDVNECDALATLCNNHGTCQDSTGNFTCECETNFSGRFCEIGDALSSTTQPDLPSTTLVPASTTYPYDPLPTLVPDVVARTKASLCTSTEWLNAAFARCQILSQCQPGSFEKDKPTAVSDRTCSLCSANSFTATTNAESCTEHRSACDFTKQYQERAPTSSNDRVCTATTTCSGATYETQPPTATTDRVCNVVDFSQLHTITVVFDLEYNDIDREAFASAVRAALRKAPVSAVGYIGVRLLAGSVVAHIDFDDVDSASRAGIQATSVGVMYEGEAYYADLYFGGATNDGSGAGSVVSTTVAGETIAGVDKDTFIIAITIGVAAFIALVSAVVAVGCIYRSKKRQIKVMANKSMQRAVNHLTTINPETGEALYESMAVMSQAPSFAKTMWSQGSRNPLYNPLGGFTLNSSRPASRDSTMQSGFELLGEVSFSADGPAPVNPRKPRLSQDYTPDTDTDTDSNGSATRVSDSDQYEYVDLKEVRIQPKGEPQQQHQGQGQEQGQEQGQGQGQKQPRLLDEVYVTPLVPVSLRQAQDGQDGPQPRARVESFVSDNDTVSFVREPLKKKKSSRHGGSATVKVTPAASAAEQEWTTTPINPLPRRKSSSSSLHGRQSSKPKRKSSGKDIRKDKSTSSRKSSRELRKDTSTSSRKSSQGASKARAEHRVSMPTYDSVAMLGRQDSMLVSQSKWHQSVLSQTGTKGGDDDDTYVPQSEATTMADNMSDELESSVLGSGVFDPLVNTWTSGSAGGDFVGVVDVDVATGATTVLPGQVGIMSHRGEAMEEEEEEVEEEVVVRKQAIVEQQGAFAKEKQRLSKQGTLPDDDE